MGMRVVAFDPYIQRLPKGVEKISSLQNLLGVSDVVSIHLPLLPETKYLISRQEFSQCKVGAILINTSRGAIVDSEALVVALETGALSAAALDVIEDEERVAQHGRHLLIDYARDHTNLLITPHIGGATFESVEKTDLFILRRYFRDQGVPISTVDF
jgi:D-3-phosphoglycerate dehydrogenase